MEHYDVLIATPGTDLKAAYVDSLVKTLAECDKRGLTYKWLNGQSSLVHHAREITMSGDMRLDPDDKGPMHGLLKSFDLTILLHENYNDFV